LLIIALIVFLFVSAPPQLPLKDEESGIRIPIERVFAILEAENDAVRSLWTKEIVKAGKKAGLEFDEKWRDADIEAGPLPALFLRETAKNLERSPIRLSLYLGSDFPIREANLFEGDQMEKFRQLKTSLQPQFFFVKDTRLYTAMFSDIAVSEACISCHNDHKDSPKSDWKLNDIMGATTWMYPKRTVSLAECLAMIKLLRNSYKVAYTRYLQKVLKFKNPPVIGGKWPRDGYYLPNDDEFYQQATKLASKNTMQTILDLLDVKKLSNY